MTAFSVLVVRAILSRIYKITIGGTQKQINESFANHLKIESRIVFLRDEASKLKYSYLSEDIFDKHIDTLKAYTKGLPELISMSFTKMQLKATALLADSATSM